MQHIILNTKNLNLIADSVDDLIVADDQSENDFSKKYKVIGVKLGIIYFEFLYKNFLQGYNIY
jgi:hypothetical protein